MESSYVLTPFFVAKLQKSCCLLHIAVYIHEVAEDKTSFGNNVMSLFCNLVLLYHSLSQVLCCHIFYFWFMELGKKK